MNVRFVWLVPIALLLAALPQAPPAAAASVTVPFASPMQATVDGAVNVGEYPALYGDPVTGMTIWWGHDDVNLTLAIVSPGTGWAAIGFGPEGILMDRANIVIGYVLGATTVISDEFGVGLNHVADIGLGGTDDILERAGSEGGGKTILEARIPLDSGDSYDILLQPGRTFSLVLAYHATSDDLVTLHTVASVTSVALQRDPSKIPTRRASLQASGEGEPREGANVTLVAHLLGDDGLPLPRQLIEFYVNTTVGDGLLGVSETDANGTATFDYTFLSPGSFRFIARFEGDWDYLPTSANVTLLAQPATGGQERDPVGLFIQGLVAASVAGVLVACVFALDQVRQIRRIGRASRSKGGRRAPREKHKA